MFIEGLGLSGYRSFSGSLQEMGPFAKINLLIGQNNSGKSNVLSFIHRYYEQATKALAQTNRARLATIDLKLEPLDHPKGEKTSTMALAFGLRIGGDKYTSILESSAKAAGDRKDFVVSRLTTLLNSEPLSRGSDVAWFRFCSESIPKARPRDYSTN